VVGSATGWVLRADAHARVESSGENDAENGAGHENE
jgi:ABC-type fe3+-hydroxamate transport system, periplasmic component